MIMRGQWRCLVRDVNRAIVLFTPVIMVGLMNWIIPILVALAPTVSTATRSFTLTMSVRPDTAEGQTLLAREAGRRCAPLGASSGRYRFKGSERVDIGRVKPVKWRVHQEFTCGTVAETASNVVAVDPNWEPTPAIEQYVRDATQSYFALVDAGDGQQVHARWNAANQNLTPLRDRQVQLDRFRSLAGAPGGHRILKLTWHVNPDGVEPGAYVAVDYEKRYARLAMHCGYIVWHRQPDGRFLLVREELGTLKKAQAAKMSPATIAELRAQLRCPPA